MDKKVEKEKKMTKIKTSKRYAFKVFIKKTDEGIYVAECPAVVGCARGISYQAALQNLKKGMAVRLDAWKTGHMPVPQEVKWSEISFRA